MKPDAADHCHSQSVEDVCRTLGSSPDGLDPKEAEHRLSVFGPNRLAPTPPVSALRVLAAQFQSIVVALLVAALMLSVTLGDRAESIAIAIVIAVNAGMGFVLELRARRAMEALQRLAPSRASVWRAGALHSIDVEAVVRGDVVELVAGQRAPADGRIISEADVSVDEAALTGSPIRFPRWHLRSSPGM